MTQTKGEKREQEKAQERERFNEFIHDNRLDLTEVAEKTGITRQVLYYATTGRNALSIDIHREMARSYKNYDLNWQMLGVRSAPAVEVPSDISPDSLAFLKMKAENARMKIELEYLRKVTEENDKEKAQVWQLLETAHSQQTPLTDSNFNAVNGFTTDLFYLPAPAYQRVNRFTVKGEKTPVVKAWAMPRFMEAINGAVNE